MVQRNCINSITYANLLQTRDEFFDNLKQKTSDNWLNSLQNIFMRGAIYLNFCSHVKDVVAKPYWKIWHTNCETRHYERRLILNLYRLIWRHLIYWLNCRDAFHTRMLKSIVFTNASIFSIGVHEYIYRLYFYCATIWITNHPNRSSGSISRR